MDYVKSVNRTKLKTLGQSNWKGSYFGPAPDFITESPKLIENKTDYWDMNGIKHKGRDKPVLDFLILEHKYNES